MVRGLTFDTGALIALEKGSKRMRTVVDAARHRDWRLTVPAAVLLEWWRAGRRQADMLQRFAVEPMTLDIAKAAGEALAALGGNAIDAAVMASAALRGDAVYTSDVPELLKLNSHFPNVRLFSTNG